MALEQTIDPHLNSAATVSRMAGLVTVLDQQGQSRELQVGDQIQPDERIVVTPNSGVLLLLPDGSMLPVGHMPAVNSTMEEAVVSLEDQPVEPVLIQDEDEALIAKSEFRNETEPRHQLDDDQPVSSSITEESVIEMDLSQVNPDLSRSASNLAGMDFSEYDENHSYGKLAGSTATFQSQAPFVNFAPIIVGDSSGHTIEDTLLTSSGTLQITDQNASDVATVSLASGKGACGIFSIDQQGHWAYQLDNNNPRVQALGEGEQLSEKFMVTVTDSHGASVDKEIVITVDGTNDKPVIAGVYSGDISEGSSQEVTGTLTQTDKDATDSHRWSVDQATTAQHGNFTIDQNGQWHYKLDNTDPAVNTLAHGQQLTETINVKVADNHGGETTQQVTVTINGTNTDPVIGGVFNGNAIEDKTTIISDKLTVGDTDATDTHSFGVDNPQGSYGRLSVDPNTGQWTYVLDHAKTDSLPDGAHRLETFNVSVVDNNGGRDSHQIIIDVAGSNDKPVITSIAAQSVNEGDADLQGQISSTDIDKGDTASYSTSYSHSGFSLNKDGSYRLDLTDKSFDHLAVGEQQKLLIPVTVTDSKGATDTQMLEITVHGTNDLPTINPVTAATVAEGSAVFSGQLSAMDVDTIDTATYSTNSTQPGFSLKADGSYTIDPTDPAFDKLAVGQSQQLSIPVTVTDNNGGTSTTNIEVTITGTNDKPVIGSVAATTVAEGSAAFSGQLTATDVDTGDTFTYSSTSTQPGFSLQPDGSYTIDPTDPVFDKLAVGQSQVLTIPVTVTDNNGGTSTTNIEVTITGTNDKAVISSTVVSVTEDTHPSASIQLGITDADAGEANFQAGSISGAHGTATLAADGGLTYKLDNAAVRHLNAGQSITDTITVKSADGTTHDVSVTINGTNDKPVINAITAQSANEDGSKVTGTITSTDVDTGDTATYATTTTQPGFTLNKDGSYSLDPTDSSFQHLAVGETQVVTIPVIATDKHGGDSASQNIVITITGTNDIPVVSAPVVLPAGTEDLTQTITSAQLLANATDVDSSDKLSVSNVSVDHGSVTIDSAGTLHFTPQPDYNGKVTFSYDVIDGHGGVVSTTASTDLAAVQDAATITSTTVDVTEDTHTRAQITLGITDPDAGEAKFQAGTLTGAHGSATLTEAGELVYTLDNAAAQHLNVGQSITDTIKVTSTDGTTHQVIINITGNNDAPVISNVVNQSAIEDGKLLSGHLVATDADSGDSLAFSAGKAGLPPGMTLDSQGNYSLDPSHAVFQHLAAGETRTLVVPVQVTDSQGAIDTTNITIVVTGSNDIPTLTVVPDTGNPQQGGLQGTDVDTTDTLSYSVVNANGQFGSLSIDPNTHQYSYTQAQTVAGMNYDKATQTYSGRDVFEVKVSDGKGGESSQFISFDVNGQVSAPTPGNPGVPVVQTSTTTATVGNTAPPVTTALAGAGTNAVTIDLVAGSDSGQSATDNITKDSTPTIAGQTDIPFSKVEIVEGGKVIATTTSDASGQYSVTTPMLTDANHDLIAQATAPSASTPVSSSALNIVVDTQIDTGTIDITDGGNIDGIINLQEAGNAKISGRIDAAASLDSLEITDANGNKVTVPAVSVSVDPATGQYVTTVDVSSLSDGKLTVTAIATDAAGNTASVTDNIVLDTFVPPAINPANIAFPTLGNNPNPTLTVTTPAGMPPGTQVQVTIPPATAGGTPTVVTGSVPAGGGPVAITLPTLPQGTTTPGVSLVTPSGNSTTPVTASITVDTTPPSISIDAIDTDNVINAAEHKRDLTITGKTDAEVGQEVTVTVDGTDYKGSVAAGGIFSVTVPASTVAAFTDGQTLSVSANVSDKAGNSATPVTANVSVDTTAQLSIDAISTDNVINSAEHKQPLTVSGTATGVENGETVTVAVGANTYTATVTNGTFTVTVPATDVQALASGSSNVAATVTDQAGNIANAVHPISITDAYSGAAATVDISDGGNTDNIINATEKTAAVVTGSIDPGATLTELKITDSAGSTHTVDLKPGQVTVDTSGNYSVHNVDVSSLTDGKLTVEAVATDSVGNTSTATDSITLDTATPPALPAGAIIAPAISNNTAPSLTVNVPTGSVPAGTTIQTTILATTPGGQPTVISTVVPANGGPVTVQLPTLPQGTTTPTVQLVTPSGNTSPAVTAPAVTVDTTPPSISIDAIDTDNVINAAEHKTDLTITGKTDAEVGQEVTVNVAGTDYKGSVAAGGTFSVTVPAATVANFIDGQNLNVTASVTDAAGNAANPASAAVAVDLNAAATITVDSVTTDNIINAAESGGKVNITGTVAGNVRDGDSVTLTVNGNAVTGTVTGGKYTIAVDGADLKADSKVQASVTVTDAAGNSQTATTDHAYTVDTAINASITLDNVTTDNIVNATEAASTVAITGTVGGDVKDGDTVTVSISGNNYTGAVSGGAFSIDVPGSQLQHGSNINASVTTTDAAGNSATATGVQTYSVDTTATASVTVDSITTDNVINAAESGAKVNVTGTVGGDVKDGDTVILTVNGKDISGTVSGGQYSIAVDGSDLKADSSVKASVTATDAAGNTQSASVDHNYTVDTAADAGVIFVNKVTGDDLINAQEAGAPIKIEGFSGTGDIKQGDTVTTVINGHSYTTTTTDATGLFTFHVDPADLKAQPNFVVSIDSVDTVGNHVQTTSSHSVSFDLDAAQLGVSLTNDTGSSVTDHVTSDGALTITNQETGASVEYSIDGGKNWTNAFTPVDGINTLLVRQTDAAGNTSTPAALTFTLDNAANAPTVALQTDSGVSSSDKITNDGRLLVSSVEPGAQVEYSTDGKNWSSSFQPTEGVNNVLVRQTDAAGNVSPSSNFNFTFDSTKPVVTLTHTADSNQTIYTISGSASADIDAIDIVVTRGTNSFSVHPQIDAQGNWSYTLPSAAGDHQYGVMVSGVDKAGNTSLISTDSFVIDTRASSPVIRFESTGTDNVYNAQEVAKGAAGTITATIALPADAKAGDTLSVNGRAHILTDTDIKAGNVTQEVLPGAQLTANITDALGNTSPDAIATAATADLSANASIQLDSITADNIVNATEAGSTVPVTGSVGGDAHAGDTVTITVGGATHTGTVDASGNFSINVPGGELQGATSVGASVTTTDAAGNTATATGTQHYSLDTTATASLTVDSITPDNVINAAESGAKVNVTGTVGGDVKDGDTVILTVNGKDISGTVSGGQYSIAVDGADLKADSSVKASVTATDAAGNTQSASVDHNYDVDTTALSKPHIETTTDTDGAGWINIAELARDGGRTFTLKVDIPTDAKVGDAVLFPGEGVKDIVLTQTDMNRGFVTAQLTVPPGVDVSGNNAWIELDAQLRDAAGNLSPIATIRTNVDTVVGEPKITFESAGADGIYSASEVGADKTITAKIHLPVDAKLGDYLSINGVEQRVSPLANRDNTITTEVKPGETLTVTFRDQHGNVSKSVTATAATADTTASATDDSADVTEDKTGVASGNVLGNDADAASVTTTGDIAGKYGTFHFNSDGSYTYTLDNSNPAVQKLAPSSAPLLDSVPYTAVDDHGNTVTANLNINIHGLIDAPALTASHEAITFNPIDAIADGRLGNTNVDLTAFTVSGRSIENAQGHLDLGKADATLVHRSSTAIGISDKATVGNTQFVNTDETLLIQLQGESRSALITLGGFASKSTSTGRFAGRSDDRMHWVAYDHNGVKVDEGDYDPKATDVGSTSTAVITTSTPYTYLAIQAQHNPDPNVGEARFTVNHVEAPLIAYETKVNFNGVLGDDTNSGETLSYKVTGLDVLSGFNHGTKNPDGSWTISAKDAADLRVHHVGALDLTVQAIATDGAASANSAPVALHIDGATGAQYELISGVHSGATTEDGLKPVQGDLGIDTTAPGQHEFVAQTTTSKYGTFTLDASGHWTYQVNQSGTQSLGKGDMQHEVFTVVTNNGVSREVTVDIRGIDDASVVGGRVGSVTEDKTGQTQVSDKMTVTDIDSDVSTLGFKSVTEQGTYGDLTIRTDGSWTYALDSAKADSLAAGDIAHESFSIPLIDTTTGRGLSRYQGPSPTDDKIEITINGTNDAAVIGGVDQASTREGDTTAVGGSLTVSDADHDQDSFTVVNNQAGDKGYGSFSVDANGQWSYKLDNNNAGVRALNASDKVTDSIVVHSADGTAHTISVEITGQDNQAPSLQANTVNVNEDNVHFFTAAEFGFQDADGDSLHHITIQETPKNGLLSLGTTLVQVGDQISASDLSRLIFTPLPDESGQGYASFKITASDGQTDSAAVDITLNVNAINDAPVVESSSILFDSVREDGATDIASGHIDVTDVDGDSLSYSVGQQPQYGTLSIDSKGQWTYQLDNSNVRLDTLDSGQSLTDYARVKVSDGHGGMVEKDISIVIDGSNDRPNTPTINPVSAGNDLHPTITGTGDPGTHIELRQGHSYVGGGTVQPDGTFSIMTAMAMVDGSHTLTAISTDSTGKHSLPSASQTVIVDTQAGSIFLDEISGDVIESTERGDPLIISGSTQGIEAGQTVTVTFNNQDYQAQVAGNGSFSVSVPASVVAALPDGTTFNATARVSDTAGNMATAAHEDVHTAPTYAAPDIQVDINFSGGGAVSSGRYGSNYGSNFAGGYNHVLDQNMQQLSQSLSGSYSDPRGDVKGSDPGRGRWSRNTGDDELFVFRDMGGSKIDAKGGDDFVYLRGTIRGEIKGGTGTDTLILGSYSSHEWRNLRFDRHWDHRFENIMTNDGVWVRGHAPSGMDSKYFQTSAPSSYEYDVDINVNIANPDVVVHGIRVSSLPSGVTLQDYQGNDIRSSNGVYLIDPQHPQVTLLSDHALDASAVHLVTEVQLYDWSTGSTDTVLANQVASDEVVPVGESSVDMVPDEAAQDTGHQAAAEHAAADTSVTGDASSHDASTSPAPDEAEGSTEHPDVPAENADLAALVASEETTLDFTHLPDPSLQTAAEATVIEHEASPLNAGDVLDSTQAGDVDILHAVDKLDPSKPDVVDKGDGADKATGHNDAPDAPVDDLPDVMPDRAAMDSQLVEPPDEHQQ